SNLLLCDLPLWEQRIQDVRALVAAYLHFRIHELPGPLADQHVEWRDRLPLEGIGSQGGCGHRGEEKKKQYARCQRPPPAEHRAHSCGRSNRRVCRLIRSRSFRLVAIRSPIKPIMYSSTPRVMNSDAKMTDWICPSPAPCR